MESWLDKVWHQGRKYVLKVPTQPRWFTASPIVPAVGFSLCRRVDRCEPIVRRRDEPHFFGTQVELNGVDAARVRDVEGRCGKCSTLVQDAELRKAANKRVYEHAPLQGNGHAGANRFKVVRRDVLHADTPRSPVFKLRIISTSSAC